jgi:hypothetical protein
VTHGRGDTVVEGRGSSLSPLYHHCHSLPPVRHPLCVGVSIHTRLLFCSFCFAVRFDRACRRKSATRAMRSIRYSSTYSTSARYTTGIYATQKQVLLLRFYSWNECINEESYSAHACYYLVWPWSLPEGRLFFSVGPAVLM